MFHSGRKRVRRACAVALTVLGIAVVLSPPSHAGQVSCEDRHIPVTLAGTPQEMFGRLCVPAGATAVQVLIPGGTYNSAYWDSPYDPAIRSFRVAANNAGHATLTVDRLGTGRSTKPLSATVTAIGQAHAVHEVVQALRAGSLGTAFDKVILGGHSLGSAIAMMEAGTYHDVDAVLITGMAHRLSVLGTLPLFTSLVPAALEPRFSNLDAGYLTTRAGTRYTAFHSPGPLNPEVTATDESTKDVIAPGEVVDGALIGAVIPYTRLIDVPVLVALGDDPSFCGLLGTNCSSAETLRASEAIYYSPAARLKTYVHHGYGHAFNYAPDAPAYHDFVMTWADEAIGD
ncbi:alpha/beta hydrolase [Actinokineospora xionganensis]|uniref:alpha/beta hydrolase n=1 Tax=Actinokineospora xionganensis TaxID=2684470 RepID=UPI001FE735F9|nr:alpha/beta fold hydrolase [Actinokineospora xionganensis]